MSPSSDAALVRKLPACLSLAGFNAAGVLDPERFEALVPPSWQLERLLPGARSVVVLGTGGRAFFRALRSARSQQPSRLSADAANPVDEFAAAATREAALEWERAGWPSRALDYLHVEDGAYADFVGLGRACGLGTPSRLGLLLHPTFGPWFAIRALLLSRRVLAPTPELTGEGPCYACPAPCTQACPVSAPTPAGFDTSACRTRRSQAAECRLRCDARRACIVGPEHAYDVEAEAHHMLASLAKP